jgi:acylphosphatase
MPKERRRLLYSGRVQGVGFRYTALRLAGEFDVAGFVRNLDDGRVELVAEGEPAELDGFLEAIRGELGGKIRGVAAEPMPPGGPPLAGFSIRH